ncbi:MAG TPA: TIGR03118 family protein [Gaiellaceae bacterium]
MRRSLRLALVAAVSTLTLAAAAPLSASPPGGSYNVTPLVSDVPGAAAVTDPHLVNGWGLARSATSPWWVADNGMDLSTLYISNGTTISINPLVVGVDGGPTGVVFAGIPNSFLVGTTATTTLAPANFVFASEDGMIRAWRGGSTAALVTAHGDPGAIYKGLAIAQTTTGPMLYATDFHNAHVDVFNGAWQNVTPAGSFVDPMLPSGYGPFGIQVIGGRVFVSYAKQDADAEDDVAGQGLGFVDVYDLSGNLLTRVVQRGQLNSPWGLALAPASFGRFAGDLLVGNFGDGQINAYEETAAGFEHRGTLRDASGGKLVIDGLWALQFGNAGSNGNPDTLFFTAGPNDESHGLFGTITPAG